MLHAALGLCIACAFWPGLRSGFHSDDFVLITEAQLNHFDLSLFKVDPIWWFYRPLGKLAWLCMYRLWGLHSGPYHAVSLALHWLNAALVLALARQLVDRPRIALGASLLFALLPFHAEAVVWLASLYDLLATAGYLAALLCLLWFWRRPRIWLYLLSLLAYQLSLWSKELAFTLPLMIVVLWLLWRERPCARTLAITLSAYLLLLGINLLQRVLVWGAIGGYASARLDYSSFAWDHLAGTLALMLGPLHRMILPASVVQLWMIGSSALVVAGLMAGLNQRTLLLVFAWLGLTLLPVLNIMPPGPDLQNTRQLYLPGVGWSIGLAALLDAIVERYVAGRRAAFALGIGAMSLLFAMMLWVHIQPWVAAGHEAIHAAEELHRFIPTFPAGSRLQVAGLPDNYQGAYIFRLGFDHAYGQRYGSLFELEHVPRLPPLGSQDEDSGAVFQVAFTFDPAATRWEITRAAGLAGPEYQLAADGAQQAWEFGDCAQARGWQPQQSPGSCEQGQGLRLMPHQGAGELRSPPLQLPFGWSEVLLEIEADEQTNVETTARLRVVSEGPTERSAELRVLSGHHSYLLFLPPSAGVASIEQIRLTAERLDSAVTVKRIVVRAIP